MVAFLWTNLHVIWDRSQSFLLWIPYPVPLPGWQTTCFLGGLFHESLECDFSSNTRNRMIFTKGLEKTPLLPTVTGKRFRIPNDTTWPFELNLTDSNPAWDSDQTGWDGGAWPYISNWRPQPPRHEKHQHFGVFFFFGGRGWDDWDDSFFVGCILFWRETVELYHQTIWSLVYIYIYLDIDIYIYI